MIMLLLAATFASATAPHATRNCQDDRGRDRCAAEAIAAMERLYGVEPIGAFVARGEEARRTFYVDGYGRDVLAITFARRRGGDPKVEVRAPAEPGGQQTVLEAVLSLSDWEAALSSSRHAHRALASEVKPAESAGGDGEVVSLCLHSWVYVYQGSRREHEGAAPIAVTRTEDACSPGLVAEFADVSAERARASVPSCQALDPRYHRNIPMLLNECTRLKGDRIAAAQALNRLNESRIARPYKLTADDLTVTFVQENARFFLEPEREGKPEAAREFLSFLGDQERAYVFIDAAEGTSSGEAILRGRVQRYVGRDDDEPRLEEATVRQRWSRNNGFDFRLAEVTVTPFKLVPEKRPR